MKIRSITYFCDVDPREPGPAMDEAGQFLSRARREIQSAGYEVQTVRVALPGFPALDISPSDLPRLGQELERRSGDHEIDYLSVGAARLDSPKHAEAIPELIAETSTVFAAAELATPQAGIDLAAVRRCADVIHRCAPLEADGFGNLRFAALANVPAGVPFLPAAFHAGGPATFALATESADLAVDAFSEATSFADARHRLTGEIERHAARLAEAARKLEANLGPVFGGIDFSLAPFPTEAQSIGTALEQLGVPAFGFSGSATVAAFLTSCCDEAEFPRTGFSGLFLPVLEDSILARRSADGGLGVEDLLLYSTVCGTGLDTLPLPGSIAPEALAAILLDVATLALRHDKPLTARLMPMPGKKAGDPLEFDFPFFAGGRVLAHKAQGLRGLLAGQDHIPLTARRR